MADVANYVPCLVIIDVQQGMFTFRRPIYQGEEVLARIAGLLERARSAKIPIFHVQHDGGPGHVLAKGIDGAGCIIARSSRGLARR
jgi:nicotinamidase-related amidase